MKRGTVIAHSGHASVIFDKVARLMVFNGGGLPKRTLQTIVTGADSGGHTGLQRLLGSFLWKNPKFRVLFSKLNEDEIDVIPVGDIKSQIGRWNEDFGARFIDRADNEKYKRAVVNLFKNIFEHYEVDLYKAGIGKAFEMHYAGQPVTDNGVDAFLPEMIMRLQAYLECYQEALNEMYIDSPEKLKNITHALGNVILHFLYLECLQIIKATEDLELSPEFHKGELGVQDLFFGLLRNLNLIPQNIWMRLLREKGMHLYAETETGIQVKGEGAIDDMQSNEKLKPDSYRLFLDEDCQEEITKDPKVNEMFDSILETTDFWIIPAGSVTNWLPILNQFGSKIRESGKPVYMFVNAFEQINEPLIQNQIKQVVAMVGRFQLIIPEKNADVVDGYDEHFKFKYTKQRKVAINFNGIENWLKENDLDVQVHKMLNWKALDPGEGGLKYREDEISLIITLIGEALEKGESVDIVEVLRINGLDISEASPLLIEGMQEFLMKDRAFREQNREAVREFRFQ